MMSAIKSILSSPPESTPISESMLRSTFRGSISSGWPTEAQLQKIALWWMLFHDLPFLGVLVKTKEKANDEDYLPFPCPSFPWCFCFLGVFLAGNILGLFGCFLLVFQKF